jgi:hypothetical protein
VQQHLLDTCEHLVELWFMGIAHGASQQASEQLVSLLDADVALKADGVTGSSDERVRGRQ